MNHDRLHARKPTHDIGRWSSGVVESVGERDGHRVVTVRTAGGEHDRKEDGETVDLVVTFAVYELFLGRVETDGGSPIGERVWYRKRG
ncbi:hypothetical protein [Natronomonas sp. LN261]|jgi:hypothetical protein|uniref:DUF7861 family protein n=1 Tax=Natronomonas sp. LN261 TaxID=2750669 RepID=UPI0015EF5930|nr:hypothetical protein [Natronomonas sp. LN261]